MKRFIINTSLISAPIVIILLITFYIADGYTDAFYLRFTSKKQSSLILGTSRAAQGLQPKTLNQVLGRTDFYNYSFTIGHSPYGPTYLKSIQRKLDSSIKNGIFILTIDPWSISSKGQNPNDTSFFEEANLMLAKTKFVNINPNILYLLQSYDKNIIYVLLNKLKNSERTTFLHNDGWLDVTIDMDTSSVVKRMKEKIKTYKKDNLPFYKFSTIRLEYFKKTISYLKQFGSVYVVRLPIHSSMMAIDNAVMPNFTTVLNSVSTQIEVPYLDLTPLNNSFRYLDANHLYKESGEDVSRIIGNWIKTQEFKKTHPE